MLKIVVNRDVSSSGSQREGDEGKDMEALVMAFGEEEAQPRRVVVVYFCTFLHRCNVGRGNLGMKDLIFSPP